MVSRALKGVAERLNAAIAQTSSTKVWPEAQHDARGALWVVEARR